MDTKDLATVLHMRLLVGYLGEATQYGWWPSSFFSASSRMFLEPAFPKTASLAQYHAVVEAARRLHDEHLSLGSFHLFRLPEEAEQDLHGLANAPSCEQFMTEHLRSRELALQALQTIAAGSNAATPGPMLLGRWDDAGFPAMLKAMAGAYHAAFQGETKTFPYLAS